MFKSRNVVFSRNLSYAVKKWQTCFLMTFWTPLVCGIKSKLNCDGEDQFSVTGLEKENNADLKMFGFHVYKHRVKKKKKMAGNSGCFLVTFLYPICWLIDAVRMRHQAWRPYLHTVRAAGKNHTNHYYVLDVWWRCAASSPLWSCHWRQQCHPRTQNYLSLMEKILNMKYGNFWQPIFASTLPSIWS